MEVQILVSPVCCQMLTSGDGSNELKNQSFHPQRLDNVDARGARRRNRGRRHRRGEQHESRGRHRQRARHLQSDQYAARETGEPVAPAKSDHEAADRHGRAFQDHLLEQVARL